jgi:hypothetical protein
MSRDFQFSVPVWLSVHRIAIFDFPRCSFHLGMGQMVVKMHTSRSLLRRTYGRRFYRPSANLALQVRSLHRNSGEFAAGSLYLRSRPFKWKGSNMDRLVQETILGSPPRMITVDEPPPILRLQRAGEGWVQS